MKHKIFTGLTALLVALTVNVALGATQDVDVYAGWLKPGPPPLERFVKPLGLSSEQQRKLKPIFAQAQAKAAREEAEIAKGRTPSAQVAESALLTREADLRVQLSTVLTQEQMMRYESLTASRAANARTLTPHPAHGHYEMNSPAPPAK